MRLALALLVAAALVVPAGSGGCSPLASRQGAPNPGAPAPTPTAQAPAPTGVAVPDDVAALLRTHGWTVAERLAEHRVTLPKRFADEPGSYPVGFYWAYNNLLSAAIGLDFSPLAGQTVTATLYRLNEPLGDDNPNQEMRAVIIRHQGRLAGAYLDRMGHFGFAAALDRRTFPQLTGKPFGQWLTEAGVVDWNHPIYREWAALSPTGVINTYYRLLDEHTYDRACTLLTLRNRATYLFVNRDRTALYNPGFAHNWDGIANVRAAVVKGIGEPRSLTAEWHPGDYNRKGVEAVQHMTSLDLKLQRELTSRSGPHTLFITTVREVPQSPWLIDGTGTGP